MSVTIGKFKSIAEIHYQSNWLPQSGLNLTTLAIGLPFAVDALHHVICDWDLKQPHNI